MGPTKNGFKNITIKKRVIFIFVLNLTFLIYEGLDTAHDDLKKLRVPITILD